MRKTVRQMILGLGTFGTGTALLYLEVNPYLLVLADTVVGVGMLFAAGSLSMDDLRLPLKGSPAKGAATDAANTAIDEKGEAHGPRDSMGRIGGPLQPSIGGLATGKEAKEAHAKEIDQMLDTTLAGQSRRLISIAEGQGTASTPAQATGAEQTPEDLLQGLSGTQIPAGFSDDEEVEEGTRTPAREPPKPGTSREEVRPIPRQEYGEAGEGVQAEVLSVTNGSLGADDLLSALRLEAMKEKRKDDTSLLRDLKGVKVSGRQLLDELDSLVRELRGK
jgi:hypothetical protein